MTTEQKPMRELIANHEDKIKGTISALDRLVLRNTLFHSHKVGMDRYIRANQVLLKEFDSHVERVNRVSPALTNTSGLNPWYA